MKKVLAIIPARGGSKGLPGKNIRRFLDRPLIGWTIEAAKNSKYIHEVVVSTDDSEIKKISEEFGAKVPFLRPEYLATDKSVNTDVILHAIGQMPDFDVFCYLQPTSPLRTSEDIDLAFEHFFKGQANCCVSVKKSSQSPFWSFTIDNLFLKPLFSKEEIPLSRQDLLPTYTLNGAIYIANKTWFTEKRSFLGNETLPFVMPDSRSIDIDTLEDFEEAERLARIILDKNC